MICAMRSASASAGPRRGAGRSRRLLTRRRSLSWPLLPPPKRAAPASERSVDASETVLWLLLGLSC